MNTELYLVGEGPVVAFVDKAVLETLGEVQLSPRGIVSDLLLASGPRRFLLDGWYPYGVEVVHSTAFPRAETKE